MDMSLSLLAFMGAFAIGYGCLMDKKSSFENGSFIYQILLIAGGAIVIVASVFMKFVFSVI